MSVVLVTGGGGFLGEAIVRKLRARGIQVRSFSRQSYPVLDHLGVEQVQGDLADGASVAKAVAGVTAVIHTGARPGVAGPLDAYHRTNVLGTLHVLTACRRHGVRRLVYTSSPSVVYAGLDQEGIDERASYPERWLASYPRTKAEAERYVLAANDHGLATVALRPHLIWGPGDHHLVPRLVDRARRGRMSLIGSGAKLVDAVYVDNAADAHLLALDRLEIGSPIAGRAYFITNQEPWPLRRLVDGILAAAGLPPVRRELPPKMAYAAGWALETAWTCLRLGGEPPLTRFVARQLATAHWYDQTAARHELGYVPEVSMAEGLARLSRHFAGSQAGG